MVECKLEIDNEGLKWLLDCVGQQLGNDKKSIIKVDSSYVCRAVGK